MIQGFLARVRRGRLFQGPGREHLSFGRWHDLPYMSGLPTPRLQPLRIVYVLALASDNVRVTKTCVRQRARVTSLASNCTRFQVPRSPASTGTISCQAPSERTRCENRVTMNLARKKETLSTVQVSFVWFCKIPNWQVGVPEHE